MLLIVFVLLVLALIGPAIGGTLFGPGGMWEDNERAAGWALGFLAGFAGLSLLAILAVVIVGIILLVRLMGDRSASDAPDRGAQEEKDEEEQDPLLGPCAVAMPRGRDLP